MRIKVAAIILVVFGIGLIANLLIDNRTMDNFRLKKTTAVCLQCHTEVPEYGTASWLHAKKSSFNCGRCHGDINMLKTTDRIHGGLQWLAVGVGIFTMGGIFVSLFMVSRRQVTQ